MLTTDPSRTRRIELILRQIDSLPTLPIIATRLLSLTSSDESHARQVIELVRSDPAITAKVLALCRAADAGIRDDVVTIDRAVILLGFDAIRNAVLSVKVFETFAGESLKAPPPDPLGLHPDREPGLAEVGSDGETRRFDRTGYWRHSLGVAVAAEAIAAAQRQKDLPASEAFVCGLLHDIGKLALDHVLPKSYSRVVELTDVNQGNIAEFERRIVGLDHHTAGKRLAEQWNLPHRLQDCIWLHGSAYDTLPRLEHRRMIGLISLADLIVRRHHLGYSGNYIFNQATSALIEALQLDRDKVEQATARLHDDQERRARALGLDQAPSRELFLDSIQRANLALGRLNAALDRRSRTTMRQSQVLDAISAFHASATPGRSVQDVINAVITSSVSVLGQGFYAVLYEPPSASLESRQWLVSQFGLEGRPVRGQLVEPPPHSPDLATMDPKEPAAMSLMGILPWIADFLHEAPDLRQVRLLPLSCGWGTAAVILHDRPVLPPWQQLSALASTWGAAIAAASQHDGARRLGEELAEANRALAHAQDRLLQSESMARLGEMAAGAAHEMNNPLAVISGRSQLLTMSLDPTTKEHKAAQTIFEQAHRLSDLITSLRLFADPPRARRQPTDLPQLLQETIKRVRSQTPGPENKKMNVFLEIKGQLPKAQIDGEQIGAALAELLANALQAQPKTTVTISAQYDTIDRTLIVQVSDDGVGMDDHTLAHAMDPFFSNKPAGRRVGMGLPRAQQWAAAHGGKLELRSTQGEGTVATLCIPLDSATAMVDA